VNVVVIGGGISGHLMKLRVPNSIVMDARQAATPMTRQYGGNYLWEPLRDIECRSFTVFTTVDGQPPEEGLVSAYKAKIGKGLDDNWRDQFRPEVTGYEIVKWPTKIDIVYGCAVQSIDLVRHLVNLQYDGMPQTTEYDMLVSTIPLPTLLEMTGSPYAPFRSAPIHVTTTAIPLDAPRRNGAWVVNYISDPNVPAYRTTDRDGARHYETLTATGIPTKKIMPGKIWPHAKKTEYLKALADHDVFCFGRFASWSPEELVHETDKAILTWVRETGL
jgi:hypothetical protein